MSCVVIAEESGERTRVSMPGLIICKVKLHACWRSSGIPVADGPRPAVAWGSLLLTEEIPAAFPVSRGARRGRSRNWYHRPAGASAPGSAARGFWARRGSPRGGLGGRYGDEA